ncbi:MAG: hypothetical protein M0D55_05915 [Elusimicrobiota bacterium]|nr:MAG: hypothetical protein M0D55_05915 [Elusimicrobiota bacterium]
MRVKFWGVRGSIAAPGPKTLRYGGNTPCVELEIAGETYIIDAGTGIRELGFDLMRRAAGKPVTGRLFIGHTHWDHIQGFPFLRPSSCPRRSSPSTACTARRRASRRSWPGR